MITQPFIYNKQSDSIVLSVIAFAYTLAWNWPSPGPVFLSDTVAYLVSAAILAGHHVDAMGSWHAGYSILLAPLFLMDDPFWVWKGVQVTNAALVAFAVYLSGALIDQLRPELDRMTRATCLAVVILYPAFSAIAGYAFASSILSVNVLLISLHLAKNSTWSVPQAILLGLLAGFSFWIHPIGVAVMFAAFIALFFRMGSIGLVSAFAYLFTCILMVGAYIGVHETLFLRVTPAEFSRFDHYEGKLDFNHILSREGISRFLALATGHLSYQLVSTLGLAWMGAWYALRTTMNWRPEAGAVATTSSRSTAVFSALVVFGTIGSIAALWAGSNLGRTDFWIYGRHTDAVVHPLLLIGLLAFTDGVKQVRSNRWLWGIAILMLIGLGLYLHQVVDMALPHNYPMTLSFWPLHVLEQRSFLNWMILGSAGLVFMAFIGCLRKSLLLPGLLLVFGVIAYISGMHTLKNREYFEAFYSKPSAIVDVVRTAWPRGTCVGFAHPLPPGLSLMERERYRMYAFYLFNYHYRRFEIESWKDECFGPLLTFSPETILDDPDLKLILRENSTELFLASRVQDFDASQHSFINDLEGVELITASSCKWCLVAGCFSMTASDLSRHSQVGYYREGYLDTDNRAGFLFFGPYRKLREGHYEVIFTIDVRMDAGAIVDVVSERGKQIHVRTPLSSVISDDGMVVVPFSLSEGVGDVEVRLRVTSSDEMSVSGYEIRKAENVGNYSEVKM